MFDLEVFVGPAIVLLGMFIGLLGFAIWGARAICESVPPLAQTVAPLVDGVDADVEMAEPLSELSLPDIEGNPFTEPPAGVNLEKTAEFEQPLTSVNTVASFSQSFWEGQEVSAAAQSDYNEAIDRIQAGLNAADAEETNRNAGDADAMAAANVLEALRHGVVAAKADSAESAAEAIVNELNNSEPPNAQPAENAAPVAENAALAGAALSNESPAEAVPDGEIQNTAAVQNNEKIQNNAEVRDNKEIQSNEEPPNNEIQNNEVQNNEEIQDDTEITRMISSEEASAILAADNEATRVLKLQPENPAANALAGNELAGNELAGNIEETVVMRKLAEQPVQPAPPEQPMANPNLLRLPPNMANRVSSFGFINNQASGLAHARQLPDLSNLTQEEAGDTLLPEQPIPFGPKMAWLAIPGFKPSEVITALRLDDVQTANWTKGLQEAYADNNQVFVSPSLGGWVLVIGKTLWERADMNRSAENISWLKEICRKFGNACFFSTMRGLGNHGWVGIRDGQIFRAYGYSGELQELIWLVGEPTEEEIAINPGFITEVREKYQPGFRPIIPDEKLVLAVAAAWSVDPGFRRRQYPADFGMTGYLN